jgi:hypothetical protein
VNRRSGSGSPHPDIKGASVAQHRVVANYSVVADLVKDTSVVVVGNGVVLVGGADVVYVGPQAGSPVVVYAMDVALR